MGAAFSFIKPEHMAIKPGHVAAAGLRPIMRIQPVKDANALPAKKDEKDGKAKEQNDTSQQTVDELQNKFGF